MEHKEFKSIHYWINRHPDLAAPCLVFTHGMAADHSMYDGQMAHFSAFCTVISWDMPLHGLSAHCKNFSYKRMAQALHGILEQEHIEKVILVGMSMGGIPSQMFADLYPKMTTGLIALDTMPLDEKYYSKSDLKWVARLPKLLKVLPEGTLKKEMAKSISKTKASHDMTLEMLKPMSKAQIVAQMTATFNSFLAESRPISISCPTLILLGEFDQIAGIQDRCKAWSKDIAAPLHIISKAGHFSNGDNPDGVNGEIEGFVEGISS